MNTGDIPDLVPDSEVKFARFSLYGMIASQSWYQWFLGYVLNRPLSLEETREFLSKANGYGPHRYEDTWESLQRSSESFNFWRSQV